MAQHIREYKLQQEESHMGDPNNRRSQDKLPSAPSYLRDHNADKTRIARSPGRARDSKDKTCIA